MPDSIAGSCKRAAFIACAGVSNACATTSRGDRTSALAGQPVLVTPPPIVRVGRVYVPVRGTFEHLGASVVFDAGRIETTQGDRMVTLRVASPDAGVNGLAEHLDDLPFVLDDAAR